MKIILQMITKMIFESIIPSFIILVMIQFLVYRIFKFSIFNFIIKETMKEVNK